MTLPDLWIALRAAGVELTLGGETGLLATPAASLTGELREGIRAHRAEVMETLRNEGAAATGHSPFGEGHDGPPVMLVAYSRLRQGWEPTMRPLPLPPPPSGGGTSARP